MIAIPSWGRALVEDVDHVAAEPRKPPRDLDVLAGPGARNSSRVSSGRLRTRLKRRITTRPRRPRPPWSSDGRRRACAPGRVGRPARRPTRRAPRRSAGAARASRPRSPAASRPRRRSCGSRRRALDQAGAARCSACRSRACGGTPRRRRRRDRVAALERLGLRASAAAASRAASIASHFDIEADRVRLEHGADLVDLEDLARVLVEPCRDERAAALGRAARGDPPPAGAAGLEQPEGLEAREGLPQDGARDAELLDELALGGQPVAGGEPAVEDLRADRLRRRLDERAVPAGGCRLGAQASGCRSPPVVTGRRRRRGRPPRPRGPARRPRPRSPRGCPRSRSSRRR